MLEHRTVMGVHNEKQRRLGEELCRDEALRQARISGTKTPRPFRGLSVVIQLVLQAFRSRG